MPVLPEDFDISTVEELDPEPPAEGRFLHLREFFLGVFLLVAVLGWAGWQWWQQAGMQNNYRLGDQAASARHWDEAEAYFAAAGGYRDAPSRAASAAKLITERDSDYNLAYGFATNAASAPRWAAALNLLRRVQEIEPDYRDVAPLTLQAQDHLYADAMQGVIALRREAQPPGLYYRAPEGWVWLRGSDSESRVRGLDGNNVVVYDVAGAGWSPRPTPTTVPSNRFPPPGSPALRNRSLVAVLNVDSAPAYRQLALDPAYYSSYIVGKKGVWGLRYDSRDHSPVPLLRSYGNSDLHYEPLGSPVTTTITTAQQEEALLSTSPDGDHILLAGWSGPMLSEIKVDLYIADADGANRRLLYSQQGGFAGAQFSPDGNYILLNAYSLALEDSQEHETTLLLSAWGAMPPRILLERTDNVESSGNFFSFPSLVRAIFLTRGVDAGKLLMVEQSDYANIVTMRDPLTPDTLLLKTKVDGPEWQLWANEESGSNSLTVAVQSHLSDQRSASPGTLFTNTLTLLSVAPGSAPTLSQIPLPAPESLVSEIHATGGYLIYALDTREQEGSQYKLYRLPWPQPGSATVQPSMILAVDPQSDALSPSEKSSWAYGATLLAYTRNGELHVRTYDGATDVLLERGVSNLVASEDQGGYSQLVP